MPGTQDLPVFAAECGDRAAESRLEHRHHVHPHAGRFRVPDGGHGLVQPARPVVAVVEHLGRSVLHRGLGGSLAGKRAGDFQYGSRSAVHEPGVRRGEKYEPHTGENCASWHFLRLSWSPGRMRLSKITTLPFAPTWRHWARLSVKPTCGLPPRRGPPAARWSRTTSASFPACQTYQSRTGPFSNPTHARPAILRLCSELRWAAFAGLSRAHAQWFGQGRGARETRPSRPASGCPGSERATHSHLPIPIRCPSCRARPRSCGRSRRFAARRGTRPRPHRWRG